MDAQFENSTETAERLMAAIRKHRDYRGDDRCHFDDEDLYKELPEGYTPPERDSCVELERCRQYIACRHNPATTYVSPQRRIEELEAENQALSDALWEVLQLQNTYAELLNIWDGGQRRPVQSNQEWLSKIALKEPPTAVTELWEARAMLRAIRRYALDDLNLGLRGFAEAVGIKPSDWARHTRQPLFVPKEQPPKEET